MTTWSDLSWHFFYASRIHSIIFLRGGVFKLPWAVYSWEPSAINSSYLSVTSSLKGAFQQTSGGWIYFVQPPGTTTISVLFPLTLFFTESMIWHKNESQARSLRPNKNFPRTLSARIKVRPSFIHDNLLVMTRRCNDTFASKFLI